MLDAAIAPQCVFSRELTYGSEEKEITLFTYFRRDATLSEIYDRVRNENELDRSHEF